MVNYYDAAMLVAGICLGRVIFDRAIRLHLITRLLAAFPCYGVIWFEVDKIGRFASTEIASPDQILLFFTGVGMIWGGTTRILPSAFRALRIIGGCLFYKPPGTAKWVLRALPMLLAGLLITWLSISTLGDAETIATEVIAQYLSKSIQAST